MTELNRLLQALCDAEVDFIIVGGFAAMLHGSSMLTRDLDVCAILTDATVAKLRTPFRDLLNPTHRQTPQRLSFLDTPDPGVPLKISARCAGITRDCREGKAIAGPYAVFT